MSATTPTTRVAETPPPEAIDTIAELAQSDPLAHPLAFQHGCLEYDETTPPHLTEIHCSLYDAITGASDVRHLARIMPREHGKSEVGAHIAPAWAALRDPSIRILLLSHTEDVAKAKLSKCAATLREWAPKFGIGDPEAFPTDKATALTLPRPTDPSEPTIKAAGMKSGVTGGHYDLIVFDDMVDWDMQRTEDRREKYVSKFEDYQNLGSAGETTFIVLGTRKHPKDIYNHIISNPVWDTVVAKAIEDWSVIENYDYDIVTQSGHRYPGDAPLPDDVTIANVVPTRECDVLWPDYWPLEDLIKKYLSSSDGSLVWKRENQNDAHALMGQVLDESMLTFEEGLPEHLTGGVDDLVIYVGVDIGIEDDPEEAAQNESDYWAVAVLGFDPTTEQFHILQLTRRRGMSMQAGVDWLEAVVEPYQTRNIFIESVQAQRFFAQAARDEGLHVTETQMQGQKEDRILTMSARFENGVVRIPRGDVGPTDRQLESFLSEWAQFPTGEHDDLLDAVAYALHGRGDEEQDRTKTAAEPFV
jgi:predicted phage terminase large subunit-like protein